MQPIPEAVAWAERADAWAQRPPEGEQAGQLQRSRWSDVAATGRPAFPADGVGWRTETAEWRATEQTARWRQTTEWRSASGTHGWRSTTEAWQTGAGAEDFRPPTDPPTRQQLAISGTAWPTPQGDEPSVTTYEAAETPPENGRSSGSWQRFTDTTPPWQPAATDARPTWQQFAAPPAPWDQAPAAPWQPAEQSAAAPAREQTAGAPWQQAAPEQTPDVSWRSDSRPPAQSGSAWQQLVEPDRSTPGGAAPGNGAAAAPYGSGFDPGRHLVREDDRARWRRDTTGYDGDPRPGGRRRAPEPGTRTSAGTGWSTRSDADNWAGHADTGSIQMFDESAVTDAPSWGTRSEAPAWRRPAPETPSRPAPETPSRQQSGPAALDRQRDQDRADEPPSAGRSGSAPPAWQDDDRGTPPAGGGGRRRAEDDTPGRWGNAPALDWRDTSGRPDEPAPGRRAAGDWRDDTPGRRVDGAPSGRRDDTPSWQRSAPRAIGWQRDEDRADDDRDAPARRPDTGTPAWRQDDRTPAWQHDDRTPAWRQDDRDTPDRWQDDRTPGWRRDESGPRSDDRTPAWLREDRDASGRGPDGREHPGLRQDAPGWEDTGSITGNRRRAAAPADPWAQNAADTGVIPFSGEPPATDTGSWRPATGAIGRARPSNPNRRRDDGDRPGDTSSRIGDTSSRIGDTSSRIGDTSSRIGDTSSRIGRRRAEDDDVAPVDPAVWRREPGTRADGANWPAEEPPADWRRELRAEPEPSVSDAVTEVRQRIDPAAWQREGQDDAVRGTATYREGNTGDWRRDLAAESAPLADGESRRFGTQDFVPFRPVGSAAVAPPPLPVNAPPEAAPRREELLVRNEPDSLPVETPEQWPPRRSTGYQSEATGYQSAATGAYERRPVGGGLATAPGRPSDLLEPDEDEFEEDTGGPLAAVGYTVIWYGVPVVLFVLYMLVLNGSQQAHALSTLAEAAPQFGLSLVLSMVVAVGLRWASGSWKAASVGLAAAVMGGGLATVLSSAITGNSLS